MRGFTHLTMQSGLGLLRFWKHSGASVQLAVTLTLQTPVITLCTIRFNTQNSALCPQSPLMCLSRNKQRLLPCATFSDCFYYRHGKCLLCAPNWRFKENTSRPALCFDRGLHLFFMNLKINSDYFTV